MKDVNGGTLPDLDFSSQDGAGPDNRGPHDEGPHDEGPRSSPRDDGSRDDDATVEAPLTYAYLVQVGHDGRRWDADWTEPSGGFERSAHGAAHVARQVLARRFLQMRGDRDAPWKNMWIRVDVWRLGTIASVAPWSRHLQSSGVAPDAVEVRTPTQVRAAVGT